MTFYLSLRKNGMACLPFLLVLAVQLTWVPAFSQSPVPSFFDSLSGDPDQPAALTLEVNVKELLHHKLEEVYQPASLHLGEPGAYTHTYPAKVRVRGNRRRELCFYPPLKIKFRKNDLEKEGLARAHNQYKLVVQCYGSDLAAQYIWKEYLAYRLYNQVSAYSFRVRAVNLFLVDSEGRKEEQPLAAFLIEDIEQVEERLEAIQVERKSTLPATLERKPFLEMAAFQYMIGNTDWYVYNSHNLELVKAPEYDRLLAVPYDFDYSGLVNTTYSVPHESLPIRDVQNRWYMGEDCTREEAEEVRLRLVEKQDALLEYCRQLDLLNEKSRKQVTQYLEKFFKKIDKPGDGYSLFRKKN